MKVYTYSEARQRLASLLDQAGREGEVQIRRRDGQVFVLQAVTAAGSPLDIPAVQARLRRGELEELIRESRGGADHFWDQSRPSARTRRKPATPVRAGPRRSGSSSNGAM